MAQESAQRRLALSSVVVLGYLPGFELTVHIFLETELALLHEVKRSHGCHGLTNGASQEKRGGCHRRASALCSHSITLGADDPIIVDHSDTHARYLVLSHEPLDVQPVLGLLEALRVGAGLLIGTNGLCVLR